MPTDHTLDDSAARPAIRPTEVRSPASGVPFAWQRRHGIVLACFLAVVIGYLDRINMSVAVLAMEKELGWDPFTKGIVLSAFAIGYVLFQVPASWLVDRIGGHKVLGLSVLWWSIATVLTPLAAETSLTMLIGARVGLGLGEAAMFPAIYSLLGRWVPPAERSRASALTVSGIPAGTVAALMLSGIMIGNLGWPMLFYTFGGVGLLWSLYWFIRMPEAPSNDRRMTPAERELLAGELAGSTSPGRAPWPILLRSKAVWALAANHFCTNWGVYVIIGWLPSYLRDERGLSVSGAGLLAIGPWVAMFLMINIGGWASDAMIRAGYGKTATRKIVQVVALISAATGFLLIPHAASTLTALLLLSAVMAGLGLAYAAFPANSLDLAPGHAGSLQAFAATFGQLPGFIAIASTGWLVQVSGAYSSAFSLAAVVCIAGAVIWLLFASAEPVEQRHQAAG